MPVANIEGTDIHYVEAGGPGTSGSLVFVHGSGGEGAVWHGQLNSLPPGFIGIAPDLPGHGSSAGGATDSIADYARVVASLITVLSLPRPCYVIGHSMGGAVALTMALDHREVLDGVILIGSGARLRVAPQFLADLAQGKMNPGFLGLGFGPGAPDMVKEVFLQAAAQVPVATFHRDFTACDRFDVSQRLHELTLPLLLLVGDQDLLTPLKLSKLVHEQVAGSRLEVIPGGGHFVMLEQPEQVNRAINAFVTGS